MVPDESFRELVVKESAFELGPILKFQTALPILLVLLPLPIVKALTVMVDTFTLLHTVAPVTVVVMVGAVLVFTFALSLSIFEVTFVDRWLAPMGLLNGPPAMQVIIIKLAIVL